jgi:predicted RecB family nuclease
MPAKKTLRTCKNGHNYYKSSDCPVCPICEKEKSKKSFLSFLGAPARRAIENLGVKTLIQLSKYSQKDLLKLHGFGKSSIPPLKAALKAKGLTFKS